MLQKQGFFSTLFLYRTQVKYYYYSLSIYVLSLAFVTKAFLCTLLNFRHKKTA
jgi:hypothetical protein